MNIWPNCWYTKWFISTLQLLMHYLLIMNDTHKLFYNGRALRANNLVINNSESKNNAQSFLFLCPEVKGIYSVRILCARH